jgi:hypothetical protein
MVRAEAFELLFYQRCGFSKTPLPTNPTRTHTLTLGKKNVCYLRKYIIFKDYLPSPQKSHPYCEHEDRNALSFPRMGESVVP